jgi:4-aminobutyrate aminotransferase
MDAVLQLAAHKVGSQLKNGIHHIADDVPEILEVRGKGLMIGVEFGEPGNQKPNPTLTAAVMEAARQEGLHIGKGGIYRNTHRIAPPLSVTQQEADEGLEKLKRAINQAREE